MLVCYQIHTHRAAAQTYRLVDAIHQTSDRALVVVSNDLEGEPLDRGRLGRHGTSYLLESAGGYGDWSHTRRYLEVVEFLAHHELDYDWMVNITGQDYPVRPLREAEAELAATSYDGFIKHFPVLSAQSPWGIARGRSRYWFHHRRLATLTETAKDRLHPLQALNRLQPLVRFHVAYGATVGWRVPVPFDDQLVCYGGSFFCSLSRTSVEHVRQFTAERREVVRHYYATLASDESYLHTVLLNAPQLRFANDCKRYFDFRGSRLNHPRTLTAEDVAAARVSGAHFARKWDMARDPGAFEVLDSVVYHR